MSAKTKISDRAVADRGEDVLGRWALAKTIYDLIHDSNADSAIRVGVYGSWGEGKTSVLRFVENLAATSKVPVCRFPVWSAQTQSDLWGGFVDALQSLPAGSDTSLWIKKTARKWIGRAATTAEAVPDYPYKKAATALGRLAGNTIKVGEGDAKRMMRRLSQQGRVIILVDDVDRVDSALVPKLLMGLHDLFDELTGCAFVVALDPAVVSGGLGQLNPAWSSAPAFLEKIIQYPFRLPRPTAEQMQQLVVGTVKASGVQVPEQTFLDLLGLFPPNPRKIKQFIRGLQRMQPTLARFGEDEWNPTLLLVLELLRAASPDVAEELLQDRKFVGEFVGGMFLVKKEDLYVGAEITKLQHGRIVVAVKNAMPTATDDERDRVGLRIVEIASAAIDRLSLVTADDAIRHARLDHEPPVMTLRECDAVRDGWLADKSTANLKRLLSEHAKRYERSDVEVLEACALALLKRRAELIGMASDAFESAKVLQLLGRAEAISSLLEQLVVDCKVLADVGIPSRVAIFLEMRTQMAHFTNFLSDAAYASIRQRQREQLYRATAYLKDRAADVLKELKPWEGSAGGPNLAGAAELAATRARLQEIFSEFLCDSLLERFKRPGGVAAVGNFLRNQAEVWLLLTPGTVFQKPEYRARLLLIAEDLDEAVAQNFFVYLRMLAGSDDVGLTRSPLAGDASVVVPAWRAASRVRPQPGMQRQVVDLVNRLRDALKDDKSIPMPTWVDEEKAESPLAFEQDDPGVSSAN